jgi:hypothetical protein
MGIGTRWQKIRIGMRMTIRDIDSNYRVGVGIAVGVCQGTDFPYSSLNTTDYIGVSTPNPLTDYWARTGGAQPYIQTSGHLIVKKIGSAITTTAMAVSGKFFGLGIRNILFVDITKGSPNYTLGLGTPTNYTTDAASRSEYMSVLENEASPPNMNLISTASPYTGNGLLDSVCIHWVRSVPVFEFSDLTVIRYY